MRKYVCVTFGYPGAGMLANQNGDWVRLSELRKDGYELINLNEPISSFKSIVERLVNTKVEVMPVITVKDSLPVQAVNAIGMLTHTIQLQNPDHRKDCGCSKCRI